MSLRFTADMQLFLPKTELKKFGLDSLKSSDISNNEDAFIKLVRLQLNRYRAWQEESKKGDQFLPKKLKPIITNTRRKYDYIANTIEKNPMRIFDDKFKVPTSIQIKVRFLLKK